MAQRMVTVPEDEAVMICPSCGAHDLYPPTVSDDGTTTCPRCSHRFPVNDVPAPNSPGPPNNAVAER